MEVKIKKLHPDAVIPKYATSGAACFDLVAIEDVTIRSGQSVLVRTGLSIEILPGLELQIRPRSGISLKTPLRISNAPGTIDSDYRGEICVIMENSAPNSNNIQTITKGDRVAQGAICPVWQVTFKEVEDLSETQRGSGGFGSTGVKG